VQWLLWLAIAVSMAGIAIPWKNLSTEQLLWIPRVITTIQVLPFIALSWLFISDSTNYDLVRLYGGSEMPIAYRISAVWASREGPTLLWAGLLGISGLAFQGLGKGDSSILFRRLVNGTILTILSIALMMRPFRLAQSSWRGELNPLLQTDLMVFHPPLVFLFYSLCIVVMLKALATVLSNDEVDESQLREMVTPPARVALAVGTIGVGLGGLWAYTVLDWGGYWAWDPVETASLLPWLSLLLLLHLRVTPGGKNSGFVLPLAILPGWFSIHATMVTRANGVWASVHAFVSEEVGSQSDSALLRIIDLQNSGVSGTEVITYLISLVAILAITVAVMVSRQAKIDSGENMQFANRFSLWMILVLPLSRLITVDLFGAESSIIEQVPTFILLVAVAAPLLAIMLPPEPAGSKLFSDREKAVSMSAVILLSLYINEPLIATLLILLMLLKASSDKESEMIWTVAGIVVTLTSVYAYLIDVYAAGIGLLIFIWPLLIQDVEDGEEQTLKERILEFSIRKTQIRLSLFAPIVIGGTFFTLTWMLMIASVDGTSLAMHEMFGAPLILLIAAALATYSWKDTVPEKMVPLLLFGFIIIGIVVGVLLDIPIVGDSSSQFSDTINRGEVAWLLLPILIVAIPSVIRLAFDLYQRTAKGYSPAKMRSALAHTAHVGILLLLVGHIFTTTLIDRTDPSHQVVLVQGQQVSHEGYLLTFDDWTVLSPEDAEFNERFSVGDGFLGAKIDIYNEEGILLESVNPGMLRFDGSNSFPRSEVDRYTSLSGDTVFIFDWSQTQALGNASGIMDGDSGDIGLDRVRLTVYHLSGSHLVWAGWLIIVLSTLGIAVTSIQRPSRPISSI
jgi:cytochrome c-type biogenesis protein CcmF